MAEHAWIEALLSDPRWVWAMAIGLLTATFLLGRLTQTLLAMREEQVESSERVRRLEFMLAKDISLKHQFEGTGNQVGDDRDDQ